MRARLALWVAAAALAPSSAIGEELVEPPSDLPRTSKLSWTARDGSWTQSAILDFTAIGVLGAGREAGFPEVGRLRGGEPEALRLHVGVLGDFTRLAYVVRVDLAEPLRLVGDDVRDRPLASVNRVLDAAYSVARFGGGLRLLVGRQPVEVSRFHEVATGLLAAGAPPFVVDRALPARRWGGRGKLTRGDLDASLGVWLDGDSLEPRIVPGDPSIGKSGAISATGQFTIVGPRANHWLVAEDRVAVRGAALVRFGDRRRGDGVLGLEVTRGKVAGVLEVLVSAEAGLFHLSGASEVGVLLHPKSAMFVRGELDGERDLYAAGAGLSYFATDDRRSRISLYGWFRRDVSSGVSERDGVILELQAEL